MFEIGLLFPKTVKKKKKKWKKEKFKKKKDNFGVERNELLMQVIFY